MSYDAKELWEYAQGRWAGAFEMRRCRHGNFENNCKDCRAVGLLRKGK